MIKILNLLKSVKAIHTDDHFIYTSGKHGDIYINKDSLYPHTLVTSKVCKELAKKCLDLDIDTVIAPALGGIILSQWISYHLSKLKKKEIFGVYAEKDPIKTFVISRGYDKFIKDKKVLVVEDLTTTGGSVKKVVNTVREYGGKVVGVCIMVNRNPNLVNSKMFKAPLIVGTEILAQAWEEKDCHLCKKNIPINTQIGHGKKYVQSKTK